MPINSISNRKLRCCLVVLILFILIILSLPLLLIYLANSNYEEQHVLKQLPNPNHSPGPQAERVPLRLIPITTTTTNSNATTTTLPDSYNANIEQFEHEFQQQAAVNCTQHAIQANLSLIGDNFQCPGGTFPCSSCSEICIEQWRNCNGIADCPDRSDESSCHDFSGAIKNFYRNIVDHASKKRKPSADGPPVSALARPDSCNYDQFVQDQCPCVFTESFVVICDRQGLSSVPNSLLSSVHKIRMGDNLITSLDNVTWPRSLTTLVLVHNRIRRLDRSTFELAPNLSKLYLTNNEISHIDRDAFKGLSALTWLQIDSNKLETFHSESLRHTPLIAKVDLGDNKLDLPYGTRFGHCENLKELFLEHNRISAIRSHWFSNMSSLSWISLAYNQISVIEDGSFNWDYELEELNLSFNRIKLINRLTFFHNLSIQRLFLGGNPLQPLPRDAFEETKQLKSLNLTYVEFDYIEAETFANLRLDFIYFAKFRYCHYATHVRVCRPLTDGLSTFENLLAFPILKYAVWIVASVCSLGNVFVLVWRSVSPHEDQTLSLFVKNLSIADLMMGIYLAAIGYQNDQFENKFKHNAIEWMSSWKCTAIGFLAILSSELSVFILTIITIERYRSIMSIKRFEEATQRRRARVYVALAWLFSFLLAVFPLIRLKHSDYYATNGLCLPLHIDQPFTHGWQYSAFIYLGINFLASIIIITLYAHMYAIIIEGRQMARPVLFKAEKREDAILAIRFFFIVVTDCLCWIPIVVIKIMALANVTISSAIYGWLVVFIIPINSALNPIIYTLAAPTSLRAAVWRLFERICHKLDSWAATGSGATGGVGGAGQLLLAAGYTTTSSGSHSSQSSSAGSTGHASDLLLLANATRRRHKPRTHSNSASTCCEVASVISGGGGGGSSQTAKAGADLLLACARNESICEETEEAPPPSYATIVHDHRASACTSILAPIERQQLVAKQQPNGSATTTTIIQFIDQDEDADALEPQAVDHTASRWLLPVASSGRSGANAAKSTNGLVAADNCRHQSAGGGNTIHRVGSNESNTIKLKIIVDNRRARLRPHRHSLIDCDDLDCDGAPVTTTPGKRTELRVTISPSGEQFEQVGDTTTTTLNLDRKCCN